MPEPQVCLKTLINLSCPPGPPDAKMDELNDAALQASLADLWGLHGLENNGEGREGVARGH